MNGGTDQLVLKQGRLGGTDVRKETEAAAHTQKYCYQKDLIHKHGYFVCLSQKVHNRYMCLPVDSFSVVLDFFFFIPDDESSFVIHVHLTYVLICHQQPLCYIY